VRRRGIALMKSVYPGDRARNTYSRMRKRNT
jgi:hypothetical protein